MVRTHALLTRDAVLTEVGKPEVNLENGVLSLRATAVIPEISDYTKGMLRSLLRSNEGRIECFGRSGHSRSGLEVDLLDEPNFDSPTAQLSLGLTSLRLRGTPHYPTDRLLGILEQIVPHKKDLKVANVGLFPHAAQLSGQEVSDAIDQHQLRLPASATFDKDGVAEISLEDLTYIFHEANFTDGAMREMLIHGKHSLNGLHSAKKQLPEELGSNRFFVGAIRLSVGPYLAVIDQETNTPDVYHLAARLLHGVRTTGMFDPRQVEVFNDSDVAVLLKNLKVRVRFYAANDPQLTAIAKSVVNKRTIEQGVQFRDLTFIGEDASRVITAMKPLSNAHEVGDIAGILAAGGRYAAVSQIADDPEVQEHHLREVMAPSFVADDPAVCRYGDAIPSSMHFLTNVLGYVGGDQSKGKALLTKAFPSPETMHQLRRTGVGVFMAHDVAPRKHAVDGPQTNGIHFDSTLYEHFRRLSREGSLLYQVYHQMPDPFNKNQILPPHVREFNRGFWVKPEARERMEKIDTIIAMYGSAVDGLDPIVREQMERFFKRLKSRLGDKLSITHGKGPGLMKIADDLAEEIGIFRFGVGIGVEKIGQLANPRPEAMVDFLDKDRLPRQKLMDDLATFKIFNIGGAGSLEEAAITLCSQKLGKNLTVPLIFVDPSATKTEDHLWFHLHELISQMTEWQFPGMKRPLLDPSFRKTIHIVHSYDEAGDILEEYLANPAEYFLKAKFPLDFIEHVNETTPNTLAETGFSMPDFFNIEQIRAAYPQAA